MRDVEKKENRPGPPITFPIPFTAPVADSEHGAINETEASPQKKGDLK